MIVKYNCEKCNVHRTLPSNVNKMQNFSIMVHFFELADLPAFQLCKNEIHTMVVSKAIFILSIFGTHTVRSKLARKQEFQFSTYWHANASQGYVPRVTEKRKIAMNFIFSVKGHYWVWVASFLYLGPIPFDPSWPESQNSNF